MEPKRPDEPHELEHGATEGAPPAGDDTPAEMGDVGEIGEIRAAERCAERAAAVAAAEGFHPLRVRPYVAEPDGRSGDTTETSVLPVIAAAAGADPDGAAATDLGLFPTTCLEYAGDRADTHRPAPDDCAAAAAHGGRHRRRKRGIIIAAAAVAASALAAGAVAVTGQVINDEQTGMDRALPDLNTAAPEVTLPADVGPGLATTAAPVVRAAPPSVAAPSTSPSPVTSQGPVKASVTAPVGTLPTPPAVPSAPAVPTGPTATTPAPPTRTSPPASPAPTEQTFAPASTGPVLERGDTGPEVADLQRRLSETPFYHGPIDGNFDRHLQKSLEAFQLWYWVSDSTDGSFNGVYGPNTRATLENCTT